MKKNKKVTIEDMNSRELESLLRTELARDKKDYQQIHKILEKLKTEAAELPEVSQEEVERVTLRLQKPQIVPLETKPRTAWKKQIAIVAAVLCLVVLAAPVAYGIPEVQNAVAKWTDDIFWIESSENQTDPMEDYVFQTDNPGLQQLYDAVTEMGITAPVVPMWLPNGSKLVYIKQLDDDTVWLTAHFNLDGKEIAYHILPNDSEFEIHKELEKPKSWNMLGVTHYYITNANMAKAVWINDGLKFELIGNIQESDLYKIIASIYFERTVEK